MGEPCTLPFNNNHFTELCCGSEAGSYLRPIHPIYHSTLGSRMLKKKKRRYPAEPGRLQGYLTNERRPPPEDHRRTLCIALL